MDELRSKSVPVMVVEDSAILRERLCELLGEHPRLEAVGAAASAAEGWDLFLRQRPSAVLLDIQLRDGNGLELLRRVKLADPDCVVVVLTNYDDAEFEQACQRRGADFFLSKSSEFETAVALLDRLPLRPRSVRPMSTPPAGSPLAGRLAPRWVPAAALGLPLPQTA
jgi:DNA-binding NarL/FixJ family response regulator